MRKTRPPVNPSSAGGSIRCRRRAPHASRSAAASTSAAVGSRSEESRELAMDNGNAAGPACARWNRRPLPVPEQGRRAKASVASASFFFCRLAGRVSGIPGSFLLCLQQRRTFGPFGGGESFRFLGFALGLQSKFSGTRGLLGQFGLTHPFGGFALGYASEARLVHRHPGGMPLRDNGIFGRGAKLLQHRLLGGGGGTLALLKVRVLEAAHLLSDIVRTGWERCRTSASSHDEV